MHRHGALYESDWISRDWINPSKCAKGCNVALLAFLDWGHRVVASVALRRHGEILCRRYSPSLHIVVLFRHARCVISLFCSPAPARIHDCPKIMRGALLRMSLLFHSEGLYLVI